MYEPIEIGLQNIRIAAIATTISHLGSLGVFAPGAPMEIGGIRFTITYKVRFDVLEAQKGRTLLTANIYDADDEALQVKSIEELIMSVAEAEGLE